MAIIEVHEDIFDSPAQTLVNPVNLVGVMGKGLAAQFKEKVPGLYSRYRFFCRKGQFGIHQLWRYRWPDTDKQVICLPTKSHWSKPSRPEWIEANLKRLVELSEHFGITSLALPPLGCGEGGLDYATVVRPLIFEILKDVPYDVRIVFGPKKESA